MIFLLKATRILSSLQAGKSQPGMHPQEGQVLTSSKPSLLRQTPRGTTRAKYKVNNQKGGTFFTKHNSVVLVKLYTNLWKFYTQTEMC